MKKIDISVIIPVYNGEKTIKKTINSVLNQSIEKEVEIIIVDDGSNDNTENISRSIVVPNNITLLYKKNVNSGVSHARNIGISEANGEYIMFLDSDDELNFNSIEKLYNNIVDSKSDMVIGGYRRINEKKVIEKKVANKFFFKNDFKQLIEELQNNNLFNQLWNKIYISSIIKNNKIMFDEKISLGEDFKFVLDYLRYSQKILVLDDLIYNYYININGLNTKYREDRIINNINNLQYLEKFYDEYGLEKKYIYKKYDITIISGFSEIFINKVDIRKKVIQFCDNNYILNHFYGVNFRNRALKKMMLKKQYKQLIQIGKVLGILKKMYRKKVLNF